MSEAAWLTHWSRIAESSGTQVMKWRHPLKNPAQIVEQTLQALLKGATVSANSQKGRTVGLEGSDHLTDRR